MFGNFFARQSATAYFSGEVRLLQQYQPCPETFCNANLNEPISVSKRIVSQRSGKYRQAIRICLKSAFAVTRQQTLFGNFFARQSATAYFSGEVRLLQQYQPCPETFCNANLNEPISVSKRIVSQRSGKYRQAIRICLKSAFAVTRQQILFDVRLRKQSTNFNVCTRKMPQLLYSLAFNS